jgi:hypothetical protein
MHTDAYQRISTIADQSGITIISCSKLRQVDGDSCK